MGFAWQNPGMARRKKLSPAEMRKQIHALRGSFKTPGDKPFAEEWAEYKREEKELEERKYQRLAALGKKSVTYLSTGMPRSAR
jgi:hypothetical protein